MSARPTYNRDGTIDYIADLDARPKDYWFKLTDDARYRHCVEDASKFDALAQADPSFFDIYQAVADLAREKAAELRDREARA